MSKGPLVIISLWVESLNFLRVFQFPMETLLASVSRECFSRLMRILHILVMYSKHLLLTGQDVTRNQPRSNEKTTEIQNN
jgi:hypothetical protein